MNKLLKIIFFLFFFSYIFSTTVTNIEPSTVILGENVTFTLTVQDYDLSKNDNYFISEKYEYDLINLKCDKEPIDNLLKCSSFITISEFEYFTNPIKKLYINGYNTGLTITIIKPSNIKILNFKNFKNYYWKNIIFNI